MNRLQKKCIIASVSFHGLLVIILVFGSALMPGPEEDKSFRPLSMYSSAQVSDILASGGGPAAAAPVAVSTPAPPAAPAPQPQPQKAEPVKPLPQPPQAQPRPVQREPQREPIKEAVKPPPEPPRNEKVEKAKTDDFVPAKRHKIVLDEDSTKQTKRNATEKRQQEQDSADAQALAAHRRAAQEFASAYKSISKNLSSSTPLVESTPGFGESGQMTVNYRDIIFNKYYGAWIDPLAVADDTPIVTASITISSDGNVISARIIRPSGNKAMDRSIQNVLDTVTFIEPFPAGSTDKQRTVTINFNLQAKRQTG